MTEERIGKSEADTGRALLEEVLASKEQ